MNDMECQGSKCGCVGQPRAMTIRCNNSQQAPCPSDGQPALVLLSRCAAEFQAINATTLIRGTSMSCTSCPAAPVCRVFGRRGRLWRRSKASSSSPISSTVKGFEVSAVPLELLAERRRQGWPGTGLSCSKRTTSNQHAPLRG